MVPGKYEHIFEGHEDPEGDASKVLKAMYSQTQESLKNAGIDELAVYRGTFEPLLGLVGKDIRLNALSSWSLNKSVARGFGRTVITMKVPASRILSTPRTGLGCLGEWEVVVIGGIDNDRVRSAD